MEQGRSFRGRPGACIRFLTRQPAGDPRRPGDRQTPFVCKPIFDLKMASASDGACSRPPSRLPACKGSCGAHVGLLAGPAVRSTAHAAAQAEPNNATCTPAAQPAEVLSFGRSFGHFCCSSLAKAPHSSTSARALGELQSLVQVVKNQAGAGVGNDLLLGADAPLWAAAEVDVLGCSPAPNCLSRHVFCRFCRFFSTPVPAGAPACPWRSQGIIGNRISFWLPGAARGHSRAAAAGAARRRCRPRPVAERPAGA